MASPSESEMRDLEQELQDRLRKSEANGNRGFLHLRREMSDLEEQKDVDLAIFDFITYKALDAIFEWRARPNYHESDLPDVLVEMTNDWLTFMQNKHGQHGEDHLNSQTRFRARLLQFCLIFTHRLNQGNTWTTEQSLSDIRVENRTRGSYWLKTSDPPAASQQSFDADLEFPLADQQILQNREELASTLGVPETKRGCVTNIEGTPSLHDLLPLFMQLTATRVRLGDWEPDAEWYELVCQWMVQAVIEAYLCCGASGEDTFNTIFSVGCPGKPSKDTPEPSWLKVLRILFCKSPTHPHEDFNGWSAVKRDHIDELLPHPDLNMTFQQALHSARERYPIATFDQSVVKILKRMHRSVDKPDLVQVEQREITIHGETLSEEETRGMLQRIGLEGRD